ncbi:MAG: 2-dehydropantoate 2-reductase N-terminal domain-containing protein, partial [Pseudomonadota bacterium]
MKIAIVGAGGIGGYLAVKLIVAGAEVALVARGSHRAAIAQRGLRLVEPDGGVTVRPPVLTDDLGEIGPQDLVIVAVKAHQLTEAITQLHPALGPETRVLPFQNGVDAPDLVARSFGRDRALIGVARIFANITAPGVITR